MEKFNRTVTCIAIACIFVGCTKKESEMRRYSEVVLVPNQKVTPNPHAGGLPSMGASTGASMQGKESMVPPADSTPLRWQAPQGWSEQAGSGMRMVTFTVAGEAGSADTTIVSLSGSAGGLQGNIGRWIGQLGVESPDDAKLTAFVQAMPEIHTVEGKGLRYGNLGEWVAGDGSQQSMRAGIISAHGRTVFVKMTGPEALLAQEDAAFQELCKSIRFHAEGEEH